MGNIRIKNIYYMLSYAFKVVQQDWYKKIGNEECFENIYDLFSLILSRCLNYQIKKGLWKEYRSNEEELSLIKGKISFVNTIKQQTQLRGKTICFFDEFTIDSYMNQIIKSTIHLLLKKDIELSCKKELKKYLMRLDNVSIIDLSKVKWNFQYNRNIATYQIIITICYYIYKMSIYNDKDGRNKIIGFNEIYMPKLYEKFIFEYYKREYKCLKVESSIIDWMIDESEGDIRLLPSMKTDIMLSKDDNYLIIDAKYYSNITKEYYNNEKISSANLYQIFAYVKNKSYELNDINKKVYGMLLYALPNNQKQIEERYSMSGNIIGIQTLDLDCEFFQIKKQLDEIVKRHFTNIDI